jgi:two-component system nitrogen regulation response regulator NtrX
VPQTLKASPGPRPAIWPIELVGSSPAISLAQALVQRAASLDTGVLIVAERGADVEAVARELHGRGRPDAAWVPLECSGDGVAIDRALFGTAPPDPTTELVAVSPQSLMVAARGGTLFLQDVSELPAATQARLARIARDGEVCLEGAAIASGVRMVASATPTIDRDVREHRFRSDLYRRLTASRVDVPPLRERTTDIPALVTRLVDEIAAETRGSARSFTRAAVALMSALPWTGNLAELRSVVRRVMTEAADPIVQIEQVLPQLQLDRAHSPFFPAGNLREARMRFERDYIASVLQYHGWRVAEAAQTLGIQRPNLYRKARQLGIPVNRISD